MPDKKKDAKRLRQAEEKKKSSSERLPGQHEVETETKMKRDDMEQSKRELGEPEAQLETSAELSLREDLEARMGLTGGQRTPHAKQSYKIGKAALVEPEKLRALFMEQQPLPIDAALAIIHRAKDLLLLEPNIVEISAPVTVFGDVHGQFYDMMNFGKQVDLENPSQENKFLFLGDFVDRGAFSCEVMLYLLALKIQHPDYVYLLRGNHESEAISSHYGFRMECMHKYGLSVYFHFVSCFQALPLAALVKTNYGQVLALHGGLSPELSTLEEIRALDRIREPLSEGPLCDLLWADPVTEEIAKHDEATTDGASEDNSPASDAQNPSTATPLQDFIGTQQERLDITFLPNPERGCSFRYGFKALMDFLTQNNLTSLIRAHEMKLAGYECHFDSSIYAAYDCRPVKTIPPCVTVFSAPHYCDRVTNKGSYLVLGREATDFEIFTFDFVPHPKPSWGRNMSMEIYFQIHAVMPYIQTSKMVFEQMVRLCERKRRLQRSSSGSKYFPFLRSRSDGDSPSPRSPKIARRSSVEMHPDAIRQILTETGETWVVRNENDEESGSIYTRARSRSHEYARAVIKHQESKHVFSRDEIDLLKLLFELMDINGDMEIGPDELIHFIGFVLGDGVEMEDAVRYVKSLDQNGDGRLDFEDFLYGVSLLKENYESQLDAARKRSLRHRPEGWLDQGTKVVLSAALMFVSIKVVRIFSKHRYALGGTDNGFRLRFLGVVISTIYALKKIWR